MRKILDTTSGADDRATVIASGSEEVVSEVLALRTVLFAVQWGS